MDEENNEQNQNEQSNQVEQFAKNQAMNAGKQVGNNIKRQGLNTARSAVSQLGKMVVTFVVAHIVPIIIIVALVCTIGILIPAIDDFLDQESAQDIEEVTYQTIQDYCTIDDTGIHLDKQAFLNNIINNLHDAGVDLNDLGLGDYGEYNYGSNDDADTNSQAAQYLYEFMSASLAGEFPYIEGSDEEAQGIIKIKRRKNEDEPEKDLKYIGYGIFQEMLESDDDDVKEEIMNYFSIDSNWNLCVAKYYKQTVDGAVTQYTISEVKIPYRDMVSQYTVPFMFLIDLQLITNNATYVEAVSELMTKQSEIVLTVFDNITTIEETYTYEATRNTKTLVGTPASGWEVAAGIEEGQHYEISSEDISEKTVTVTEKDIIKANVTSANTWIIKQTTDYVLQTTKEEKETTSDCSVEEPEGEGTWDNPAVETYHEITTIREWVKSGDTKTTIYPSKFMGLWSNETGTYVKGAPYKAVGYGKSGKLVEYTVRNNSATDRPIINIVISRESLYELLEMSVTTQTHAEFMREFIKIYMDGEELDEDTFASSTYISMFEPEEYVESSYIGDFDVHDESLFITDLDTLTKALSGGYSKSEQLVKYAETLFKMQEEYKVNAIFAASVSITETSAGRAGNAVNGKRNWFNIHGKGGIYRTFDTIEEGIMEFGSLIAKDGDYYKNGLYTVSTIGAKYCPDTADHPTQAEDWIDATLAQIKKFYSAAGMEDVVTTVNNTSSGAGGLVAAGGSGYRGIYQTASGKQYVEYLQYAGTWAYNTFCSKTMKEAGCSITSVAEILTGFGIDVNPEDLRAKYPNSTNLQALIQSYGLKCTIKSNPSATEVLNHLKAGDPVIINAGGYWTSTTGHYFPVLEADGNKAYVSNVGSSTKTGWYDISKVMESNKNVLFISK